ncbi:MAG: type IV pilus biogenesis/stability protein PilW, partial [Lysobacterales bacterium]
MKILNVLVLTACGLLAGCAGTTGGGGNVHSKAPDTEAQQRARLFTELAGAYFERAQYKIALEELRKAVTADS